MNTAPRSRVMCERISCNACAIIILRVTGAWNLLGMGRIEEGEGEEGEETSSVTEADRNRFTPDIQHTPTPS